MSKMPSKKKSCFQITSVTQAQVAANSMTDEPESLDESRTEGVASSDMYDVGKSVEFETCDVTSSDDPPRNDLETCGVNAHEGLAAPGPRNPGAVGINPNVRGVQGLMVTAPGSCQHSPGSGSVTHTSFSSSATVSSCTSRFRVIKLDHSTGDPFKRGRWTCSEFYEKDTDASSSGRAAETVRHTLVNGVDKDAHGGSPGVLSTPAAEPHADSGYASAPSNPSAEHQNPCLAQPGVSITSPGVFPVGTGGAHMHHVKSPSMPPGSQPQTLYQGKQAQNSEFRPQHTLDGSSLASPPLGVPVMTPALGGSHILGLVPQSVDAVGHGGGPDHAQGLLQQPGSAPGTASAPAVVPQTSVPLIQPAGTVSFTPHTVVPGVQNVPVVKSSASSNPHSMPNQTLVPVAQSQQNQPQGIPGGLVVGLGMHNSAFSFSQFPTGITQAEDKRRKSDALPHSTVIIGKDVTKTLNADGFHLSTPAVKSLFGISIPIDGDEDSASGASVVAIDNKIEQAMDLVKSHLMYAVREEVEVLKEQIKELYERNSVLERENAVLKSLANSEQINQLSGQVNNPESTSPQQTAVNAILQEGSKLTALPPQPNVSTA